MNDLIRLFCQPQYKIKVLTSVIFRPKQSVNLFHQFHGKACDMTDIIVGS